MAEPVQTGEAQMIQGYVKFADKVQHKVTVRTEYDDLIVLRVLDRTKIDVGDAIVGALDSHGENFVLDLNKQIGVRVYVENGRRLFISAGQKAASRHSVPSSRAMHGLGA
jgi:hypothetical protein